MSTARTARRSWQNQNERHYCQVCNVWMDQQSIRQHEQGGKHLAKLQRASERKREAQEAEENRNQLVQDSLKVMEASARAAIGNDLQHFVHNGNTVAPINPVRSVNHHQPLQRETQDKAEWEAKKRQRIQEEEDDRNKKKKARKGEEEEDVVAPVSSRVVPFDQGHYVDNTNTTFLEGDVFRDILEPFVPVFLYRGPDHATGPERRVRTHDWLPGIVVRRVKSNQVDVAYLATADAKEETTVTVALNCVRIQLGATALLPQSILEARLMANLEDDVEAKKEGGGSSAIIVESTGVSAWSTVEVKHTTVRKELQEERAREREARRREAIRKAAEEKRAEARRMEETAVTNAEDSALGAYDVWNRGEKEGYKGVKIHEDTSTTTGEAVPEGKSLAQGKKVMFKKSKKKRQGRRTTSADD